MQNWGVPPAVAIRCLQSGLKLCNLCVQLCFCQGCAIPMLQTCCLGTVLPPPLSSPLPNGNAITAVGKSFWKMLSPFHRRFPLDFCRARIRAANGAERAAVCEDGLADVQVVRSSLCCEQTNNLYIHTYISCCVAFEQVAHVPSAVRAA